MNSVKINNLTITAEQDLSLPSVEYVVISDNGIDRLETGFIFYVDDDGSIFLHEHPNTGAGLVEE